MFWSKPSKASDHEKIIFYEFKRINLGMTMEQVRTYPQLSLSAWTYARHKACPIPTCKQFLKQRK